MEISYKQETLFKHFICKENQTSTKVEKYGTRCCTDTELIEILLGHGKTQKYKNREKAEIITGTENGLSLTEIAQMDSISEISYRLGIKKDTATLILAAFELGKRTARPERLKERLNSTDKAADYLIPKLGYNTHEKFFAVYLNIKHEPIATKQIAEGSLSACFVHPREVFAPAITNHAATIIVAHNHPSGDPTPSKEDIDLTGTLVETGEIIGIPVLDHIIIGDNRYYSFVSHDMIKKTGAQN